MSTVAGSHGFKFVGDDRQRTLTNLRWITVNRTLQAISIIGVAQWFLFHFVGS